MVLDGVFLLDFFRIFDGFWWLSSGLMVVLSDFVLVFGGFRSVQ